MKVLSIMLALCLAVVLQSAAQVELQKRDQFVNLTGGIGSTQGVGALSYNYNLGFGKKTRLEAGLGVRFSSYFGRNKYYRTAPAKLTSGKTGPFVIFSEDINENIDTVFFNKPQVNMLNLALNLGYRFNARWKGGLNIDLIGFSFGGETHGTYYDGDNTTPPLAKPTFFNLLLTSDNDKGSLNSEFFVQYKANKRWAYNLALGFLFTEYTTNTKIQTTPGGILNDRFRNKAPTINGGVSYYF